MYLMRQFRHIISPAVQGSRTTLRYENPFVFSTTFKKWAGWRPGEYRARHRVQDAR